MPTSDGAYCTSTRTTSISIDCFMPTPTTSGQRCAPGIVGPGQAVQFAYTVAHASSDLSRFPSGYTPGTIFDKGAGTVTPYTVHVPGATPGSSGSGGSNPTSSSSGSGTSATGSSTGSSSPLPPTPGLSTGAKAGIGVGVTLGVLALLGALLFFLRRRKWQGDGAAADVDEKRRRDDDKEVVDVSHEPLTAKTYGAHEMAAGGNAGATAAQIPMLDGTERGTRVEMHGEHKPMVELPSVQEQRIPELPHETRADPGAYSQVPVQTLNPPAGSGAVNEQHGMSATSLGPVSLSFDDAPPQESVSNAQSSTVPATSSAPNAQQAHPTVEDVELQYLENEERRIQERKAALLANRR